jgi:hypothetical protein
MDDRWPLAGRSSLSNDEIDLLKYYSHGVAPWVSLLIWNSLFSTPLIRNPTAGRLR